MSRADDDYDDRPRRRPRDDDDEYDDRPRKGKASGGGGSSVLIIVGVVVALLFCCGIPVGIGLLLPAVQKVRDAASRAADTNNLRQIGIGMFNHSDAKKQFPPADEDLSWRVHLLPYIEQDNLYREFDQKQAWDSAKNRRHADVRIAPYVSTLDPPEFKQTRVRVFTGPDTMFPPGERPLRVNEVKDGTSTTILAIEANAPVPWPQPQELNYTKAGPLPAFGHPNRQNGFLILLADGSVRFVNSSVNPNNIRNGITPSGGDGVPDF
jgi:hypothetical protein